MDDLDLSILAKIEENSRIPLKELAESLDLNSSTIYSRLHKLRESDILKSFTITINPEKIGLSQFAILAIRLGKIVVGAMDSMFLKSFAQFLKQQYKEILLATIGSDDQIWLILTFRDQAHQVAFVENLKKNDYRVK